MKAPALIAVVAAAFLTVVSCSRAETPTEPSATGFLRVTTVLEGQCPPALAPGPFSVFVDGVQVGTVPVPGASSFVVAVGSHTVDVGPAPSASGFPVYIEPDTEREVGMTFSCSGFLPPAERAAPQ